MQPRPEDGGAGHEKQLLYKNMVSQVRRAATARMKNLSVNDVG